jgi:glycosyltransferase involved in cell wall biosynthesis
VSPVRDEEKFIEATLRSVTSQTARPAEWIIVDDGSTDRTTSIIDEYASKYPWIHGIHRANRGFRKSGGGVVEAFYDGFNQLQCKDWEFAVKLDGDLVAEEDYFQRCFDHFLREDRLGIGGGTIYHVLDGKELVDACPRFHVRGATKIYRRQCWEAIGGLWRAPGWDTIDEAKAQMLGWMTETFADVRILHQRPTGTAEGPWSDSVKGGLARYIAGYHPLFMMTSCVSRLIYKPYVMGAIGLLCGYLKGYINHIPQVSDPALIRFVRDQQLRRLVGKKTVWKYK